MQNGGGRERLSAVGVECKPTTTTEATFLKKHTALIAAAALALSAGLASAQTQTPRNYDSSGAPQTSGQRSGGGMSGGAATGVSSGMTGAPSSTNPQAGGGPSGLTTAPHQVPENGGAPNATAPGSNAR
jgi:hypothetical protein